MGMRLGESAGARPTMGVQGGSIWGQFSLDVRRAKSSSPDTPATSLVP